jgi:CheY-like chemotaxis protein
LNDTINGRSNNSFNRSGISSDVIVNLSHDVIVSRPVNSGVRPLPLILRYGYTLGDEYYEVLIFDNDLPDTNGLELIRQTRRLLHRQQIPIIIFSASDIEREARRAGANVFLRKPEDLHAVAETIARLLARKPKH